LTKKIQRKQWHPEVISNFIPHKTEKDPIFHHEMWTETFLDIEEQKLKNASHQISSSQGISQVSCDTV
jgi:hypothetical protein